MRIIIKPSSHDKNQLIKSALFERKQTENFICTGQLRFNIAMNEEITLNLPYADF